MKYTVFSVDNSRTHYIDKITETLTTWEQVQTDCVDGRDLQQLAEARKKYPYAVKFDARVGHLGIWYTVLNSFQHAPVVTFEDDAMLGRNFMRDFKQRVAELPEDMDFFSLFLPRDSNHMYNEREHGVGRVVCKTYQRYGGVSMYYSRQGVQKIKSLIERDGLTGQYDDTLYAYSRAGELNGYCSKPETDDLVYITGMEDSIVQETERWKN